MCAPAFDLKVAVMTCVFPLVATPYTRSSVCSRPASGHAQALTVLFAVGLSSLASWNILLLQGQCVGPMSLYKTAARGPSLVQMLMLCLTLRSRIAI